MTLIDKQNLDRRQTVGCYSRGTLNTRHCGMDIATTTVNFKKMRHLWVLRSSSGGHIALVISINVGIHAFFIPTSGFISNTNTVPEGFDVTVGTVCCCELGIATIQVTTRGAFELGIGLQSSKADYCINRRSWKASNSRIIDAIGNGTWLILVTSDRTLVCEFTSVYSQMFISIPRAGLT